MGYKGNINKNEGLYPAEVSTWMISIMCGSPSEGVTERLIDFRQACAFIQDISGERVDTTMIEAMKHGGKTN